MTKITFKEIQILAKNLKKYVEKEGVLPESITVGKTKYTYPQIGYILAKSVSNIGKDVTVIKVSKAPKKNGQTVDLTINRTDYKKLAKILSDFIENKKRLPNYLRFGDKKIKQRVFIYSFAKIIVWYSEHKNTLPSTCKFSTSETAAKSTSSKPKSQSTSTTKTVKTTLKSLLTNQGCSGMGQCTPYYCACNSLQQMFYRLTGILVPESTIAGWAGTTTSGTDHAGINTAVAQFNKKYNKNVKISWYGFSDLSWSKIKEMTNKGGVFFHLLYRNQWGHYEPIKSVGDSLSILNSLGDRCNYPAYCGYIETRSKSTQQSYIKGISQKSVAYLYNG